MDTPSTTRLVQGADAWRRLGEPAFLDRWTALLASCPWSTAFQSPGFVNTWYQAYQDRFAPLLVVDESTDGALNGLMAFAVDSVGHVTVAGGRQAEYQVWIAASGCESSFPRSALNALRPVLTKGSLTIHYVPALTPLGWLDVRVDGLSIETVQASRPLMSVGSELEAAESFKKKSNKSRLNRLGRIGHVRFERLTRPEDLRPFMDQIATVYDVRQGSLGAAPPFQSDPRKAEFHLQLLNTPNLLHASVLRAGDTFVAGHLGVMSGGEVHVGVLAHSPFLAAHSPGKLLMMFLGQSLAVDGIGTLDLTPGGDGWKERFADRHDTVTKLTVRRDGSATVRAEVSRRAVAIVGTGLRAVGISPARLRQAVDSAQGRSTGDLLRSAARQALAAVGHSRELRAYTMSLEDGAVTEVPGHAQRDRLSDVLSFQRTIGTLDRPAFFKSVLGRLEEGHHLYTRVENGLLVHWGWLAERQEKAMLEEVHQEFAYPPDSGVLYDFYTHPEARGKGHYRATIKQMVRDARQSGLKQLYIFVLSDNRASRHVIETSGFKYLGSLFERRTFRQARRWRSF